MKISILTLFPEMFLGPFDYSIIKRAKEKNSIEIEFINIIDFGIGKHKLVDDTPFGGGAGMVMRVDVLEKAIEKAKCKKSNCKERIILTDARGVTFSQKKAHLLSAYDHLIFIAGHYEGIDERIENYIDEKISIGNFVLTGGEIPIMVMVDSIVRLIPNVIKKQSTSIESFSEEGYLEYPQYTKPRIWKNTHVPEVLLLGNHKKIEEWQIAHSNKKSKRSTG